MSRSRERGLLGFFSRPALDLFRGLEGVLEPGGVRSLAMVGVGLLAGFWIYVPLHELGHAFACLATGGSVSRLEIDPIYGAALLARVFPWVVPGGEYAGRLSGFDTGGSDFVYLATDFGPYVLTLFPGVWLLRRMARQRRALLWGAALPFAFGPFISLTGDAYEIGSILATRLPAWSDDLSRELLRGDDLLRQIGELSGTTPPVPWVGLVVAALLGTLWAFATYALAGEVAHRIGEPPLRPPRAWGDEVDEEEFDATDSRDG